VYCANKCESHKRQVASPSFYWAPFQTNTTAVLIKLKRYPV